MFRIVRLLLHQQKVIHEYERLVEHILVELATRQCVPYKPFNDDLVPDADGLCEETVKILRDAKKGPGDYLSALVRTTTTEKS